MVLNVVGIVHMISIIEIENHALMILLGDIEAEKTENFQLTLKRTCMQQLVPGCRQQML